MESYLLQQFQQLEPPQMENQINQSIGDYSTAPSTKKNPSYLSISQNNEVRSHVSAGMIFAHVYHDFNGVNLVTLAPRSKSI